MMSMIKKLLTKEKRQHDRGFSLVEIVCAVAIFGILTATIGGIIVMSARSYRNGLSETGVQQEAQMAINNIGNIIKDACSVKYGEPSGKIWLDGEETADDFANTNTELSIITNEKMQYSITYTPLTRNLQYQEFNVETGSAVTNQQVIATNVINFKADTSDFKESRAVKVKMDVEDPDTGRTIPLEYTMKSRNDVVSGMKFLATSDDVAIIFLETDIVMVPGETYAIPITVVGNLTEGLELVSEETVNASMGALTLDYVEVMIPRDTTAETAALTIRTKDKKADGSYKDKATANIKIRKVNSISVSHTVNRASVNGGTYEGKDAVYTFTANAEGSNLPQVAGAAFDSGRYRKAQAACWSLELRAGGNTYNYSWTLDAGTNTCTHTYDNQVEMENYIKIIDSPGPQEDVDRPSISVQLMQNMPSDFRLKVTATSRHALGINKANSRYPDDTTEIKGEEIIEPRGTVIVNNPEITLEPNETGRVDLKTFMFGGVPNSMRCELSGNSDTTTTAVYVTDKSDADYGKVRITLGRDEKGSGYSVSGGDKNYTFEVKLYPDVPLATAENPNPDPKIIVHVCRIDEVSIEVHDNFTDKDGAAMGTPTYDFRGRINVTDGKNDPNAVRYLIQYNEDGSVDTGAVANTLASRITWELIDNKTNKMLNKDSVICKAGIGAGNKGQIIGDYKKKYKDVYSVVNVKPARIEQDADGKWFLKQMPEIDISTNANTDTGLPADTELKVTIEMLHPRDGDNIANPYNKMNMPYKDDRVEASASIKGTQSIYTDKDIIVVEPNQGTDQLAMSDTEMVIPIKVSGGGVYKMNVKVESGKDVRLSNYKDENGQAKDNPYMFGTAAGGSERTWLLGLVIGKDADGLIDVEVAGLNTSNKVIATTTFQLAVRRVNKVDVKVKDSAKITDVNKADNVVTLEAYPTGVNGTKYYDIQKDEKGNICRWEQEGHGGYKSPLPMKWTMVINGQEKPLDQWTEYIAAGTVGTGVSEEDYKSTVTFKLVQPLPNGTEIYATSLHTLGNVDGVKYNKSGEEYGKQYGVLKIGDQLIVADGFQRADDYHFTPFPKIIETNDFRQGVYNSKQRTFFRFREVGTEWNAQNKQYRIMDDDGETVAFFSGTYGSRLFLPDRDYELDIVNVLYGTGPQGQKVIYWPQDASLLEPGKGWAENGYTLWDGTWGYTSWGQLEDGTWGNVPRYKEAYEYVKNTPQEPHHYLIPKTTVYYDKVENQWGNYETIDSRVKTIGSMSNPKQLSNGGNNQNYDKHFMVKVSPTAFNIDKTQLHFTAKIDKLENNNWVSMVALKQDSSMNEEMYKWFLQVSVPRLDVYHVRADASGTYRIRTTVTGMTWTKITGGLFDSGFGRYQNYVVDNIDLFDMSDESGVMYLKLN